MSRPEPEVLSQLRTHGAHARSIRLPRGTAGMQDLGLTGMSAALATLAVGAEQRHLQRSANKETLYVVIAGHGQLHIDGETVDVQPGSLVAVRPAGARAFRNAGDVPLVYLQVEADASSMAPSPPSSLPAGDAPWPAAPAPQHEASFVIAPATRLKTPFARPQAIAFDGKRLWIGSLATSRIYALDPADFTVLEEHAAPGRPFGMTWVGRQLHVLCGVGAEDHRLIFRFVGGAFRGEPLPCPGDTGSHLGHDGRHLYVSQWYRRRLLALDADGQVVASYAAPRGIAGQVIHGRRAYLLGTDDESATPYWLTRLDLDTGEVRDLAMLPFLARGLAFDGDRLWTNLREQGETIAFDLPS